MRSFAGLFIFLHCLACAYAVIAILRTNNRDVAFARGVELARMGCRALEVTLDSHDFTNLVKDLIAAVGSICMIGAGTVTNAAEVCVDRSDDDETTCLEATVTTALREKDGRCCA